MDAESDQTDSTMRGFPPPPESRVRFTDGSFLAYPQIRWSFNHMEQLVGTKTVGRGTGASRRIERAEQDLTHLQIEVPAGVPELGVGVGASLSWAEALATTHTDSIAVLHRGRLVHESYFRHAGPDRAHTLMSCNKSMVGLIAECLIAEGQLDEQALIGSLIPELAESAWSGATVRQLMDMTISMDFDEDYLNPDSDVWRFINSTGMIPNNTSGPATIADFLPTVAGDGNHGTTFAYREPNIFVLGWLVRRSADLDLATLASELVWQHLGAEHDWFYMVDDSGAETTASATLRDFLRFGQLMLDGGRVAKKQIVPEAAVASIMSGGDQSVLREDDYPTIPGWSYRSQWWIRHIGGRVCPMARGAYGQFLYLDPANDLVIVKFSSGPLPPSEVYNPVHFPLIDAITEAVTSSDP